MDDFFADVKTDGVKLTDEMSDEDLQEKLDGAGGEKFDDGDETPTESQTETKQEEVEPSQQGKDEDSKDDPEPKTDGEEQLPFHKHPRWKKLNDRNRELEEYKVEQERLAIEQRISNIETKTKTSEPINVPEWFVAEYGDDPQTYATYLNNEKVKEDRLKSEIKKELLSDARQQQQQVKYQEEWIDKQVDSLEEEGEKFDKNKLKAFTIENHIIDPKTRYYDFKKALRFYKAESSIKKDDPAVKEKSKMRKAVASITTAKADGGETNREYSTAKDLRGKGFNDLVG